MRRADDQSRARASVAERTGCAQLHLRADSSAGHPTSFEIHLNAHTFYFRQIFAQALSVVSLFGGLGVVRQCLHQTSAHQVLNLSSPDFPVMGHPPLGLPIGVPAWSS